MNFNKFGKAGIAGFLLVIFIMTSFAQASYMVTQEYEGISVSSIRKINETFVQESVTTAEEKRDFYRMVLDIPKNMTVRTSIAERLIERNNEDPENFYSIVMVTRELVKEDSRDRMAGILVKMDKNFVKRFSVNAMKSEIMRARAERQIRNYISSLSKIEQAETAVSKITGAEASGADASGELKVIRKIITKERIKLLFEKEITTEEFIKKYCTDNILIQ